LRKLAQGQAHTLAREFFLGMSPEWAEGKSKAEIDEWAEANIAWLNDRFGKERVKFAVLHLDEQTPHLAAYVVGLKADPKNRGNGWTLSDNALGLGGNKSSLSTLQDEYAAAMESFKLRRGIKGSKARHQTTAQWKGQMATPLERPITRPPVNVPEPTLADRFDPKSYAHAAAQAAAKETAEAVFKQMKPYQQQAKAQGKQLKEQGIELHKLRAMVEQLRPLADMLKALLEAVLGHPLALTSIQGQKEALEAANQLVGAMAARRQQAQPQPLAVEPPKVEPRQRQRPERSRGPTRAL
jgi:hypothetical protein